MQASAQDKLHGRALLLTAGLLLAFAIAFFFYYGLDTLNDPVFSIDFVPYHLAGRLLAEGDLEPLTNYAETGGFFATSGPFLDYFRQYFYPQTTYATRWVYLPAYLWIFRPLAGLDFPAAARVWLAVNALLTLACFWLLWSARRRPVLSSQLRAWRLAWFAFLVLTFQPMLSNLWHGQVTALIFALFCLSYWLLYRGRPFAAGLALGLIVPFKFYPALFVLYFAWRRQWRTVVGSVVSSLAILLFSLFTVGWEGNLAYFQVVLSELRGGGIPAFNNQSISGFLLHAFTPGDVFAWLDVQVPPWLTGLRFALILVLVGTVAWAMRRPPSIVTDTADAQDLDLSLVTFVMLLASPITWYHYYLWLLLPLVVLFDHLLLAPWVRTGHIAWLAVAYGLVVVQGIAVLQPLAAQSLQDVWLLRLLLSQSFFGALLLLGLTLKSRLETST
jgi:alpha-1,2-mannosyltransferase